LFLTEEKGKAFVYIQNRQEYPTVNLGGVEGSEERRLFLA
jgi:hypothetical protein